jgi:hypothetical protein
MSISEWLLLFQTIILFATGAILIWYTCETHKIRKETHRNSSILAELLLILQSSHKFEVQKEISFIEPIFNCEAVSHNTDKTTIRFTNKGGTIKNVSIKLKNNFSAKIYPDSVISADSKGRIELYGLQQPVPEEVLFEIGYENMLDEKMIKQVRFLTTKAQIFEESN